MQNDDGDKTLDKDGCYHVTVTLYGTWQKKYGFNSLLGVVFLLSIRTGEVLGSVVKSKVCYECKSRRNWDQSSDCYKDWYNMIFFNRGLIILVHLFDRYS